MEEIIILHRSLGKEAEKALTPDPNTGLCNLETEAALHPKAAKTRKSCIHPRLKTSASNFSAPIILCKAVMTILALNSATLLRSEALLLICQNLEDANIRMNRLPKQLRRHLGTMPRTIKEAIGFLNRHSASNTGSTGRIARAHIALSSVPNGHKIRIDFRSPEEVIQSLPGAQITSRSPLKNKLLSATLTIYVDNQPICVLCRLPAHPGHLQAHHKTFVNKATKQILEALLLPENPISVCLDSACQEQQQHALQSILHIVTTGHQVTCVHCSITKEYEESDVRITLHHFLSHRLICPETTCKKPYSNIKEALCHVTQHHSSHSSDVVAQQKNLVQFLKLVENFRGAEDDQNTAYSYWRYFKNKTSVNQTLSRTTCHPLDIMTEIAAIYETHPEIANKVKKSRSLTVMEDYKRSMSQYHPLFVTEDLVFGDSPCTQGTTAKPENRWEATWIVLGCHSLIDLRSYTVYNDTRSDHPVLDKDLLVAALTTNDTVIERETASFIKIEDTLQRAQRTQLVLLEVNPRLLENTENRDLHLQELMVKNQLMAIDRIVRVTNTIIPVFIVLTPPPPNARFYISPQDYVELAARLERHAMLVAASTCLTVLPLVGTVLPHTTTNRFISLGAAINTDNNHVANLTVQSKQNILFYLNRLARNLQNNVM